MLGFLKGLEQGVAREGAAQRQHYGTVLSSKENHLDRLLAQIKYNQQLKRQDRAYDRGVLESDRNYQLRERADRRAGEAHDFNYGEDGMMHLRRSLFKSELDDYKANQEGRNLTRQYNEKLGRYNLGQGWQEFLEDQSLKQDLMRAQIGAYNRPRATSRSGGPTWSQTRDITVENLAPVVLKHLKDEGEHYVAPWHKDFQLFQWGVPLFSESDRPFVSEDPNEVTQTHLLRQAGGHLVEELILRGVDPQTAMQMVPFYWDQILDAKGSDVLKRLNRALQAEGYDDLELRKIYRDTVYEGAMNHMVFKQPNRPENVSPEAQRLLDAYKMRYTSSGSPGADQLLDSITIE